LTLCPFRIKQYISNTGSIGTTDSSEPIWKYMIRCSKREGHYYQEEYLSQYTLFQKLPTSLFSPLAAPEAELYSEVLLVLFVETQRHQEPLSRDLCITLVADVIEDQNALELLANLDGGTPLGDNVVAPLVGAMGQEESDVRSKAGDVLRYLTRCQWLHEEIQADFTIAYTLPDYAFRILSIFHEIATDRKQALQGLICAIHDLLQGAVREGNASIRIPQAYQETMHLLNRLKELQHTIGVHIERVLNQASLKDILEQTFTSYLHQVTRRAYHELRTTDHVSRFRPGINDALMRLRANYHSPVSSSLAEQNGHRQESVSTQRILEQIENIQVQFDTLDSLLQAIDVRHSQFFDSAVRSIENKLSANTSTSGHLHTILNYLLDPQHPTPGLDLLDDCHPERSEESVSSRVRIYPARTDLDSLVSLYSLMLLDEKSLMSPRRAAEPFVPAPDVGSELTEEEIAAAQEETFMQLSRAYSRERVRKFASKLLADCNEKRIGEVPLNGPDDLPMLIYLRLYGEDGSLGYLSEEVPDAPWIEHSGIGFRDFVIRRMEVTSASLA